MTATSQNGWPVLHEGSPLLYRWTIPAKSGTTLLTLRNGSAGFLLAVFVLWWAEIIEPLVGRVLDDWGYADRPIRFSTETSNHASGTAADTNAMKHPLGVEGTLTAVQKRMIADVLRTRFKGTLRHGAFYKGRVDPMHVEVNAPLRDVEKRARWLMRFSSRGRRIIKANPTQKAVILS